MRQVKITEENLMWKKVFDYINHSKADSAVACAAHDLNILLNFSLGVISIESPLMQLTEDSISDYLDYYKNEAC